MAVTTLSMVLTVLVLNLHAITDRPVPRCLNIIFLKILAKLFCVCSPLDFKQEKNNISHKRQLHRISSPIKALRDECDVTDEQVPIISLNGCASSSSANTEKETSFIYVRRPEAKAEADTEEEDYTKEWHALAEVVDRLFFWTFLITIIAISVLLFHPLTRNFKARFPFHTV